MADHSQSSRPAEEPKNPDSHSKEAPKEELEVDAPEVLKQFDTFEVQDMDASKELLERRRKVKDQLKELDMDSKGESGAAAFSEEEGGGFLDILKEAGLGVRQFKFCCGGVLGVGLLALLIYGIVQWREGRDFSTDEPREVEDETQDPSEPSEGGQSRYPDDSLWAGMHLGDTGLEDDESLDAGEDLGLEGNGDDALQKHIHDFSKVYESAQVDVNELLNRSSDRREALQEYVQELNFYHRSALQSREVLLSEVETLTRAFSTVETNKDEREAVFFEELEELDAYASTAALDAFVGYGQELIRLRAHYFAREKLLAYYEQIIPYVENKLLDIELNEEALVKGIRVVEVEGSDLDLIESVSDL
ncbi:hypothetical protein IPG41_01685 [Candidatus Peregrinibacteria bacterium]|nr:MAG: hypothetical protein IPG41_01685 [Candidatus Peregrinibacteria bacterium]